MDRIGETEFAESEIHKPEKMSFSIPLRSAFSCTERKQNLPLDPGLTGMEGEHKKIQKMLSKA